MNKKQKIVTITAANSSFEKAALNIVSKVGKCGIKPSGSVALDIMLAGKQETKLSEVNAAVETLTSCFNKCNMVELDFGLKLVNKPTYKITVKIAL
jgi:hypothetical protein